MTKRKAPADRKKMGRPSTYTQAIANAFCTLVGEGMSMREACALPDMPGTTAICSWLIAHPDFAKQYAGACARRADALHDETVRIADDASEDMVETKWKDAKGKVHKRLVPNTAKVQRDRLRIDTRMRVAGQLNPKKYSPRLALDVTEHQEPVTDDVLNLQIAERLNKIGLQAMLKKLKLNDAQVAQVIALFQVHELPTSPTKEKTK